MPPREIGRRLEDEQVREAVDGALGARDLGGVDALATRDLAGEVDLAAWGGYSVVVKSG